MRAARTAWSGGLVAAILACFAAGPVPMAFAAPTLSVSVRLAPAGAPLVIAGAGCGAGAAVSVRLEGPIVPPGPGGPETILPATADAAGAWSLTTSMPVGTVSVTSVCGVEFAGGIVISSDLTTSRSIGVVWIDHANALLDISGGVPTSSIDILTAGGQVIGQLVFDSSGIARGQVAVPEGEVQLFGLGREFLLSEFPSPAAWRGVLPSRPDAPPTTTATTVPGVATTVAGGNGSTVPGGTATSAGTGSATTPVASRPPDLIPKTGAGRSPLATSIALACCALGAAMLVSTRRGARWRSSSRRPDA